METIGCQTADKLPQIVGRVKREEMGGEKGRGNRMKDGDACGVFCTTSGAWKGTG